MHMYSGLCDSYITTCITNIMWLLVADSLANRILCCTTLHVTMFNIFDVNKNVFSHFNVKLVHIHDATLDLFFVITPVHVHV